MPGIGQPLEGGSGSAAGGGFQVGGGGAGGGNYGSGTASSGASWPSSGQAAYGTGGSSAYGQPASGIDYARYKDHYHREIEPWQRSFDSQGYSAYMHSRGLGGQYQDFPRWQPSDRAGDQQYFEYYQRHWNPWREFHSPHIASWHQSRQPGGYQGQPSQTSGFEWDDDDYESPKKAWQAYQQQRQQDRQEFEATKEQFLQLLQLMVQLEEQERQDHYRHTKYTPPIGRPEVLQYAMARNLQDLDMARTQALQDQVRQRGSVDSRNFRQPMREFNQKLKAYGGANKAAASFYTHLQ